MDTHPVVGPAIVTDRRTNQKRQGKFWAAFETREKNDKNGITNERRKAKEKAAMEKQEMDRVIAEIVEKGGIEVFEPILKKRPRRNDGGIESIPTGERRGAVLIVKSTSRKTGSPFLRIDEVVGSLRGVRVGANSPMDKSSFPNYIREALEIAEKTNGFRSIKENRTT